MGEWTEYYCGNENRRLKSLVDGILISRFGWMPNQEYDDFYSIAAIVVWKCEQKFDPSKGAKFETYLINCLIRKIKTKVTYMNRKKRNNGIPDISMDATLDDNGDLTIGEIIASREIDEISDSSQMYLDSLSRKQREIADLIMQGYDNKDIKRILGLSEDKFQRILQRMKMKARYSGYSRY